MIVDWFRVLTDLDRSGLNLPAVGQALGIPYSTLRDIRNRTTDPRYENGNAIVGLWASHLMREVSDVPRMPASISVSRAKSPG